MRHELGAPLGIAIVIAAAGSGCVPIGVPVDEGLRNQEQTSDADEPEGTSLGNLPERRLGRSSKNSLSKRIEPNWDIFHLIGFHLGIGGGWGGDELLKASFTDGSTQTLSAGSGLFLSTAATYTPLWIGRRVGFGLGTELNLMVSGVDAQNGSINFYRFGGLLGAHVLLHVSNGWFLFAGGGMQSVFAAKMSGSALGSDIQADLGGARGGVGEIGVDWLLETPTQSKTVWGGRFTVRYASLSYTVEDVSVDGSYVAVLFGLHWDPWTTRRMPD
jgi:hypothetical protein